MKALAVVLLFLTYPLPAPTPGRSILPSDQTMTTVLNETPRHGEWHRINFGSAGLGTWVVYPDRSDKAPLLLITANKPGLTDWMRAVADQAAQEGFLAVVPDGLSVGETEPQYRAVREHALTLLAANGKTATMNFVWTSEGKARMDVSAEPSPSKTQRASFSLSDETWAQAIHFLNQSLDNHPNLIYMPPMQMAMGPAPMPGTPGMQQSTAAPRPLEYPMGKLDTLPAGLMTAKSTLEHSTIRTEWVFIPVGNAKLRTRISYPQTTGKAPIVIVMHHAPGIDEWTQSIGDQLSREGFIALVPDLLSGFGPNGGNYDSFTTPDEALKASVRITPDETMRRYAAAWNYGMKLPEASGKSASLGFCSGGGNSFRFAGEVSENAAVVFYGAPIPNETVMSKINAPVLAFAGTDDIRVKEGTEGAAVAMKKLGKNYEFHIYEHATHGFAEYQQLGGNPAAIKDAWAKAIAFLKKNTM